MLKLAIIYLYCAIALDLAISAAFAGTVLTSPIPNRELLSCLPILVHMLHLGAWIYIIKSLQTNMTTFLPSRRFTALVLLSFSIDALDMIGGGAIRGSTRNDWIANANAIEPITSMGASAMRFYGTHEAVLTRAWNLLNPIPVGFASLIFLICIRLVFRTKKTSLG